MPSLSKNQKQIEYADLGATNGKVDAETPTHDTYDCG